MSNILIWDKNTSPPSHVGIVVLWRDFAKDSCSDYFSMPQFVEENADALRSSYLDWIYELGEVRLKGRRLVDHLQLRPGFSYWWMTLLVEKCNFSKSPQIDDAIRMLAFAEWAAERQFEQVTLFSANQQLAACLKGWCRKNEVSFEWRQLTRPVHQSSWARRVYSSLPHSAQAFVWLLKYLMERWSLRGVGVSLWRQTPGKKTFVTYSDNCVPQAVQQGRYENRYWAHLPGVLEEEAIPSNWLHLYVKDGLWPTAKHAAVALNSFNKSSRGSQSHVALDSFIGLIVVFRTLRDYLRLLSTGLRTGAALKPTPDSPLDIWPLLCVDWRASMFGSVAMSNLLFLNLFEAALKALPQQHLGVYLEENMGWESGFIHAWRRAGHGRLIGTPHTMVRFWDLRYFFDQRSYSRTGVNDLPLPDQVACNGPIMRATYQHADYPVRDLLDVEALRYLHLSQSQIEMKSLACSTGESLRLLVLGDYRPENTFLQMRLLELAVPLFPQKLSITVKPHPNCPIHADRYPSLRLRIRKEPVGKLLTECDVAYAGVMTSAAVDAYCAGVPIVSVLDPSVLNLSPLRGCVGALFVSTPSELAGALVSAVSGPPITNDASAFFKIDPQLPNWRKLLL